MSVYLKPVVVLVISILFFAGIYFLADTDLIDLIQNRFYNPSVEKSYAKENNIDAEIVQNHILELQNKFAFTLDEQPVRSSFLYNQSAEDIYERSRIYGMLLESTSGLQHIQFVDNNGIRIHYSTSPRDIISQSSTSTSYRNYTEDTSALPYDLVSVPENGRAKFTMNEQSERIIFSFPFFDSLNVYHGTALFTVSVRALAERLIGEGRLKVGDNVSVIGEPPGVVLGSPEAYKMEIFKQIAAIWNDSIQNSVTLDAVDSGAKFTLISSKTGHGLFLGRLVDSSLFIISEPMKIIFMVSMFLTFYLTLFFMFNFETNAVTLVNSRIKRLRDSLFEQLYVNKTSQDRAKWILELEQRRDEIRSELKRNLRLTSRLKKNIDGIIDKSWDELLAVIKSGSGGDLTVSPVYAKQKSPPPENIDDIEEVEAIEEIEEIEDVADAEEIDEIEEIEEIAEAEEIDALEEIEEVDAIEDIAEAETLEPSSKGLLNLASKYGTTKTAATRARPSKGLLSLASEYEAADELEPIEELKTETAAVRPSKGLLSLASEYEAVNELEPIEELETESAVPSGKGLLALASAKTESDSEEEKTETTGVTRKGLLELAREIEFNSEYPVGDEQDHDFSVDMDIVSPFENMFSSLDKEKSSEGKSTSSMIED